MTEAPYDKRCIEFVDYILHTYVTPESRYPLMFWAVAPVNDSKGTTNGTGSFQANFNAQFCSEHPNNYFYHEVIKNILTTTYIKMRTLVISMVKSRTRRS